jgi:hypothetical protein
LTTSTLLATAVYILVLSTRSCRNGFATSMVANARW